LTDLFCLFRWRYPDEHFSRPFIFVLPSPTLDHAAGVIEIHDNYATPSRRQSAALPATCDAAKDTGTKRPVLE
jgi:hypothetical protein